MAQLPFMVMTALEAARFREATATAENRLEPVLVRGGTQSGKYVLPERVKFDPAFEENRDAFAFIDVVVLDTDIAFPPEPDE